VAGRAWSWHELDPTWAERVVHRSGAGRGDLVLDVGAGLGALTEPLLRRGARVVAIEAHPGRAAALRERYGDDVRVVQTDAADLRLPRRPFLVVANPPFAISNALLRRVLHPASRVVGGCLLLQSQVVRRWTGSDAPFAARGALPCPVAAGPRIPRSAFRPRPHVDVRILDLG
jgi:23S rRNA (adenine-N6)-dimethyltransferase